MIYTIKGYEVIIDFDLAEMYGIETRVLKQAVRPNIDRFEGDNFKFELTADQVEEFSRSQFVTLNRGRGSNVKSTPLIEPSLYQITHTKKQPKNLLEICLAVFIQ